MDIEIEVDLDSANGPKVRVRGAGETVSAYEEVLQRLPSDWCIHPDDWQFNGVRLGQDDWSYPLNKRPQ